jgi:ABC-2 type transport system permease protein
MQAVFRRELRAYFYTPLGYVVVAVMYFFSGYYFFTHNLYGATTNLSALFRLLFPLVLFIVPVLTMRLLSEDKRSRTDQLLLTAPVSRTGIVLGKYLAAVVVYALAISATLLQAAVLAILAAPEWPVVLGHVIGLLLLGGALIAICLFLSALTESQLIAAVAGMGVSLFLMLVDALALVVNSPVLQALFRHLSFHGRYTPFTLGIVEASGVGFFVTVGALFVLLTVAVLDRARWV